MAPFGDRHAWHSQNQYRLVTLGALEIGARFGLFALLTRLSQEVFCARSQYETNVFDKALPVESPPESLSISPVPVERGFLHEQEKLFEGAFHEPPDHDPADLVGND